MSVKYNLRTILFIISAFWLINAEYVWKPIDWKTLPPAQPDDKVEVYYLVAPLLEEKVGKFLGFFDVFHGALGFVNTNTNYSITINYDAFNFAKASFFPDVVVYENGTRDLIWHNQGGSFVYEDIYKKYWSKSITLLSTIDGDLYNQFMSEFNSQVNDTYPYYDGFGVKSHADHVYLESWDCFDYVWKAMDWLFERGAHTNVQQLHRNKSFFFSTEPPLNVTLQYYDDEAVRNDIIDLYEIMQFDFKGMNLFDMLSLISIIFDGRFYLRLGTDYWKIMLKLPYWDLGWAAEPFPDPQTILQAISL